MATQQAWEDFEKLSGPLEYLSGMVGEGLKAVFAKLDSDYQEIIADQNRVIAAAAVADTHYKWTSAEILSSIARFLALRDYLIAQGFII